jgi:hypothetical protein
MLAERSSNLTRDKAACKWAFAHCGKLILFANFVQHLLRISRQSAATMTNLAAAVCWMLAAAWIVVALPAFGQELPVDPPGWQPYREAAETEPLTEELGSSLLKGGDADVTSPVRQAQWIDAGATAYPQPISDASMCDVSCYLDPAHGPPTNPAFWQWRVLPEGVMWQSYWAGVHEPRISGTAFNEDGASLLDVALGGRVSLLRFGTAGPGRPQGAELQAEGAAIPRLNLDENWDMEAADFRFGLPLVYGREMWQAKFSYYHLSSHMGDEFAVRNNALGDRINFSRDALVVGFSYNPLPAWRWYAEAGWAFHYDESEPWEFQFGVDVAEPGPTGIYGTPFIAVNGHLREEADFGGNLVAQAGWLWRGESTQTLRLGVHYYNGKSNQFEFFDQFEEQIGAGIWYDY